MNKKEKKKFIDKVFGKCCICGEPAYWYHLATNKKYCKKHGKEILGVEE